MKNLLIIILITFSIQMIHGQNVRADLSLQEVELIQETFNSIIGSDRLYRLKLKAGTLDNIILAKLDSLYNGDDISALLKYQSSITDELTTTQRDSLNKLQRQLDFTNHMIMRGIWDRYGWISKDIIEENNGIQTLLLLHPPIAKDQIVAYTENYKIKLLPEVKAGRMPAKSYASFIDNMLCKILDKPQLYGTNGQFDRQTKTLLPPLISNLEESNKARKNLGLLLLKEGEYRIADLN